MLGMTWRSAGEPDIDQFAIRVTGDRQTVWLPGSPLSGSLP